VINALTKFLSWEIPDSWFLKFLVPVKFLVPGFCKVTDNILIFTGNFEIQPKYPGDYWVSGYSPPESYFAPEYNPIMVS